MEFLYGLLTAVVFFIALIAFYFIGYKQGNKQTAKPPDTEEAKDKKYMAEIHNDFLKLMNYNEDTARQRKKVM